MRSENRWLITVVIMMFIWGSFFPVSKWIVSDLHPLLLAFLRYFTALPVIGALAFREIRRRGIPSPRDLLLLSLLGFLGITGFAVFLFYGLSLSSAAASSVLANTQPIFATLLAPLVSSERFTGRQLIGSSIGIVGMTLVVTGGNPAAVALNGTLLGNCLSVLAALAISIYYLFIGRFVKRYGSAIPTLFSMFSGTTLLLVLVLMNGVDIAQVHTLSGEEWSAVLYLGIVTTALVYLVYNRAVAELGIIRTVGMKFMIPVFGMLLSALFLGEEIQTGTRVGLGIVLSAIFLVQHPGRKTANVPDPV